MDALVGREAELARVRAAVSTSRLVSLIGPAGVGKTSLAAAIAREHEHAFCDLSEARSLNGAHSALAAALGARLVDAKLPERMQTFVSLYDGWIARLRNPQRESRSKNARSGRGGGRASGAG